MNASNVCGFRELAGFFSKGVLAKPAGVFEECESSSSCEHMPRVLSLQQILCCLFVYVGAKLLVLCWSTSCSQIHILEYSSRYGLLHSLD